MKLEPELAEILVDIEVSSQRYRTILQFFHPHMYMLIIGALVNLRAQVGYVRVFNYVTVTFVCRDWSWFDKDYESRQC